MNTTTGTITLNIIIAPAPAVVSAVVIIVCVFIKHHHNGKTVIMGFGFHYNHEIFFPVKTFMLESTLLLSHIHHYIKTRHVLDEDCLIHPDHKLKWGIFFFFFFLAKLESLIHIFPSSVLLDMVWMLKMQSFSCVGHKSFSPYGTELASIWSVDGSLCHLR